MQNVTQMVSSDAHDDRRTGGGRGRQVAVLPPHLDDFCLGSPYLMTIAQLETTETGEDSKTV